MIQMNLFTEQKWTHRHRKQIYVYQRGKGRWRDRFVIWDKQIHIAIYKIDKQQGLTI